MARLLKTLAIGAAVATLATPAFAREQIRAVGSSTVYPFVTTAAEQFGQNGKFKTPIIESTGTGGGIKLFCEGIGDSTPDLANASRKIKDSEVELCKKNGVTDIAEIQIGFDGIALANKKGGAQLSLTKKDLFTALARQLPGKDGKLANNPNMLWSDVNPSLPKSPITVYGPPPTSGTRDAFSELVMEKACESYPDFAKLIPDEKERKKTCTSMREDGKYIEMGEDDNMIVTKLQSDDKALGIFGYSYYMNNLAKVQASKIEGVELNSANIDSGKYPVSRPLLVYVKKQHIGSVPGIPEFIKELTSDIAIGPDGYVTAKGLIPLHDNARKTVQTTATKLAGAAPATQPAR